MKFKIINGKVFDPTQNLNGNKTDIYVDNGNFSSPYYNFNSDINDSNFNFVKGYTYRFVGQGINSIHPFVD